MVRKSLEDVRPWLWNTFLMVVLASFIVFGPGCSTPTKTQPSPEPAPITYEVPDLTSFNSPNPIYE